MCRLPISKPNMNTFCDIFSLYIFDLVIERTPRVHKLGAWGGGGGYLVINCMDNLVLISMLCYSLL